MPFDDTTQYLTKPSLEGLSWVLKHLRVLLPDHVWDYNHYLVKLDKRSIEFDGHIILEAQKKLPHCKSVGCAVGVYRLIYGRDLDDDAEASGMSTQTFDRIFYGEGHLYKKRFEEVTELDVAQKLDEWLAKKK